MNHCHKVSAAAIVAHCASPDKLVWGVGGEWEEQDRDFATERHVRAGKGFVIDSYGTTNMLCPLPKLANPLDLLEHALAKELVQVWIRH